MDFFECSIVAIN